MALLDSEIQRCRHELGFGVLTSSAEPYARYVSYFDTIVQPFVEAGASTTSSTAVTAATTATPVTLTLASATGVSSGDRVAIDVDDRQELATIQALSGSDITVALVNAHSGTYPVTVEGGEVIVREILREIAKVKKEMGSTFGAGALKAVDEIEFYNAGGTLFGLQGKQLKFWRNELASALRIESVWSMQSAGSQRLAVY